MCSEYYWLIDVAHKKGRCKRSGQSKTFDQGATNQRQCTQGDKPKSSVHPKSVSNDPSRYVLRSGGLP
jgi:hypothetical protein